MKSWSSGLMKTATGLACAILLAIGVSGGTHAQWSSQVELPVAEVTAGNADMAIDGPVDLDITQLYPGQSVSAPFNVHNTGTVALALQMDALTWPSAQATSGQQDFARSLTTHVWPAAAETECSMAPPVQAWSGTFSSPPGELGATVAPEAIQPMCLAVTLSPQTPSSAQGARIDLQLTVGGIQQ